MLIQPRSTILWPGSWYRVKNKNKNKRCERPWCILLQSSEVRYIDLWNIAQLRGGENGRHTDIPQTCFLRRLVSSGKSWWEMAYCYVSGPIKHWDWKPLQQPLSAPRCHTAALKIVIRAQKRIKERIVEAMKAYDTVNSAFNFNLMWETTCIR